MSSQELLDKFFNREIRIEVDTLEKRAAVVAALCEYKPGIGTYYADQSWSISEWPTVIRGQNGDLALSRTRWDVSAQELIDAVEEVIEGDKVEFVDADIDELL